MICRNEWGDILIENFVSSKLLPVAKYRGVAITLRFGDVASLKRVFFFVECKVALWSTTY